MKIYLLLIYYFFSISIYSQDLNAIIESKNDSIIKSELMIMDEKVGNLIILQDSERNILIISDKCYIKFYLSNKNIMKRKQKRLNKQQSRYFHKCIKNLDSLKSIEEKECITGIRGKSNKCIKIKSSFYRNKVLQFSNRFYGSLIYKDEYYKSNYLLDLYNIFLHKTPTIKVDVKE